LREPGSARNMQDHGPEVPVAQFAPSEDLTAGDTLPRAAVAFYREALRTLGQAGVPFLVGGAFAFERYAELARETKDFDVFVHPRDVRRALAALAARGFRSEMPYPHWLAKAWSGGAFLDLIFNSGNGLVPVDDEWFTHAPAAVVFGLDVKLMPVEEMIWSKSFILERERSDAADVAHLLRRCATWLDWDRLLGRFGPHWRVLFAHLLLFGYIYPSERTLIPQAVLRDLWGRLEPELTVDGDERLCNGTVLSRAQYLVDVDRWDYEDGRLHPRGTMTPDDVARWTAAIDGGDAH
jgi:hypothetical protein